MSASQGSLGSMTSTMAAAANFEMRNPYHAHPWPLDQEGGSVEWQQSLASQPVGAAGAGYNEEAHEEDAAEATARKHAAKCAAQQAVIDKACGMRVEAAEPQNLWLMSQLAGRLARHVGTPRETALHNAVVAMGRCEVIIENGDQAGPPGLKLPYIGDWVMDEIDEIFHNKAEEERLIREERQRALKEFKPPTLPKIEARAHLDAPPQEMSRVYARGARRFTGISASASAANSKPPLGKGGGRNRHFNELGQTASFTPRGFPAQAAAEASAEQAAAEVAAADTEATKAQAAVDAAVSEGNFDEQLKWSAQQLAASKQHMAASQKLQAAKADVREFTSRPLAEHEAEYWNEKWALQDEKVKALQQEVMAFPREQILNFFRKANGNYEAARDLAHAALDAEAPASSATGQQARKRGFQGSASQRYKTPRPVTTVADEGDRALADVLWREQLLQGKAGFQAQPPPPTLQAGFRAASTSNGLPGPRLSTPSAQRRRLHRLSTSEQWADLDSAIPTGTSRSVVLPSGAPAALRSGGGGSSTTFGVSRARKGQKGSAAGYPQQDKLMAFDEEAFRAQRAFAEGRVVEDSHYQQMLLRVRRERVKEHEVALDTRFKDPKG